MRVRHKSLAIFLLGFFAHQACAGEDSLGLRMDRTPLTATGIDPGAPAVIEADNLAGQKEGQIKATGNVTLRQGSQSVRADQLLYQQNTHQVDAQGSVVLVQEGSIMSGPRLQFNMDSGAGTMDQPQYSLKNNGGRGTADIVRIQDNQHYTMDNATYTTCPAGNQDWYLDVGTLAINRETQIGTAHSAVLDFKGVPILYSPWMNFALNNQRKSGFLSPIYGTTVTGGPELTVPYYLNIAPNLDATIAPRYLLKRGLMLNDEFRYMGVGYSGMLNADVLPNDAITHTSRSRFAWQDNQTLGKDLSGYVNYTHVSDSAYFIDLGTTIADTSQVDLLQEVGLNYNPGDWTSALRVQHYQTLQNLYAPIIQPYTLSPQLTIGTEQIHSGADVALASEFVDFTHPTAVNGSRLLLNPSVSYPLINNSPFYLTPKASLSATYYALGANNVGNLPNAARVLPLFSLDSGVAFDRQTNMFGGDYQQTLEPRAYYVYVPYRDQSMLPNFDSDLADFNFTQIFTENRFSGSDRIGDANQITLATTSRLVEQNTGMERLKLMLGERISFITPRVTLPALPATTLATATGTTTTNTTTNVTTTTTPSYIPATTFGRSDILLAASGQVSRAASVDSELQYDPIQSQAQIYNIATHYNPEAGKVLNLGYRFDRNTVRQVDFSTQWPVFNRWHMLGRWNYSIQDRQILNAIAGLEYTQSCWTLRIVAQRFAIATMQTNTTFFVQLDLSDVIKVGSDPMDVLKQGITGYTNLNNQPVNKPAQGIQ
jgi:LPS-assembly protein